MKILYDISVLGAGHYACRARTGIFRVVENIANGLAISEDIDLSLCAINSLEECLDYLNTNAVLGKIPLSYQQFYVSLLRHRCIHKKNIKHLPFLKQFPIKMYLSIFKRILKVIRKRSSLSEIKDVANNDIFHSPFLPFPQQIRDANNIKKFLTVYDLIPLMHPHFFEFHEDHLLKKVVTGIDKDTWLLSISQATKEDLCNYSCEVDPDKIFVTHLAASELFTPCFDLEKICSVKRKYCIPDNPYILSLCTLEPRKNIDHTIRCFVSLVNQEHIDDLSLVLVGSKGWDYDKIFGAISNSKDLKDRIIVTGYVADEDLSPIYSGALAFVYPSFYEGFGLPPLEAMQCGVPVITSNTSSLPEVVGDAGILVAPTDSDALCQSLLGIYNRPALRQDLSIKSIERAKQFSWEKCVKETIGAYKAAVT